ncbi:MAG TPA: DUF1275 family protein [Lapillicoccus sp.]|nr:DUF1275 family protein [Lapillicoccus sp.]
MSTAGRTEVALAAVLAATAGAVDVLAFTRLGQAFASIVTGNLVVAGAGLGLGQPQLIGSVATAVVAFAVGVLLGGLGVRQAAGTTARWPVHTTALCAVELVFLAVLGVVWVLGGGAPSGLGQLVALAAAAVAMGLQSAAFRLVPLPGVTTTYFTGTLTVLLLGLVTGGRVNGAAVVALLALLAGAVAAGLLVAHAATAAVLLPLALVVVVLVASTVRRRELWAERGR